MHDIAVTIITIDRTPRQNYLPETLENFVRGGVFDSLRFHSLHIADSGGHEGWPDRALQSVAIRYTAQHAPAAHVTHNLPPHAQLWEEGRSPAREAPGPFYDACSVYVYRAAAPRTACVNGATALDAGIATGAPWILFCEDDLDVCAEFLDSVGRWLDEYADPRYHVFPFGAAYPQVREAAQRLQFTWEYPTGAFYGTQCVALRRTDAIGLANYWRTEPEVCDVYSPSAFDLMLADWHRKTFPEQPYLLASAPSFVQHLGRDSIATNLKQTHYFTSWPGRLWMFEPGVVRV